MNCLVSPTRQSPQPVDVRSMVLWLVGVLGVCVVALGAVYVFTPWPRALHLRYEFDGDGDEAAQKLAQYVPTGVAAILDQPYDSDKSAVALDVYHPDGAPQPRTTVVWIHGGGWLAGSKEQIANYARILAARGFTVAMVGYSLAPGRNLSHAGAAGEHRARLSRAQCRPARRRSVASRAGGRLCRLADRPAGRDPDRAAGLRADHGHPADDHQGSARRPAALLRPLSDGETGRGDRRARHRVLGL